MTDAFTYTPHAVMVAFAVCFAASMATILGSLSIVKADRSDARALAFGLAFAGGAMVYISFVEIFQKSFLAFREVFDEDDAYRISTLCFFAGMGFIVLLDHFIPNPHPDPVTTPQNTTEKVARVGLMTTLAITAHNFPEGAATFFATLDDPVVGLSLAIAIAIHNIPEGISIAIPVYYATGSRLKALIAVTLSAIAEPIGALIAFVLLAPFLSPSVFGAVFGFIAGAMVFLALDELLPAAKRYAKGHETVYGMVMGMAIMAASLVLLR